jgi:hypothetical protein
MVDISGCRFSRLVAISPTDKRSASGGVVWTCRCDCGVEKLIDGAALRQKLTHSCGCLARENTGRRSRARAENVAGNRYHKWTVIRRTRPEYCLAVCDCGTQQEVHLGSIRYGLSTSCGCGRFKYSGTPRERDAASYQAVKKHNRRDRYNSDKEFRARVLKQQAEKYANDKEYRKDVIRRAKASHRNARESLSDAAIREMIVRRSPLSATHIPETMVAVKRAIIQIKRFIRAPSVTAHPERKSK